MKTKLVAVIALIFCAFMAEASKVEGNGNIITKEISVFLDEKAILLFTS